PRSPGVDRDRRWSACDRALESVAKPLRRQLAFAQQFNHTTRGQLLRAQALLGFTPRREGHDDSSRPGCKNIEYRIISGLANGCSTAAQHLGKFAAIAFKDHTFG